MPCADTYTECLFNRAPPPFFGRKNDFFFFVSVQVTIKRMSSMIDNLFFSRHQL